MDLKPGKNGIYETYWVVDDDDFTRMRGIEACVEDGFFGLVPKETFRGFRAEIYSPTSGTQYQEFGDMSGLSLNTDGSED